MEHVSSTPTSPSPGIGGSPGLRTMGLPQVGGSYLHRTQGLSPALPGMEGEMIRLSTPTPRLSGPGAQAGGPPTYVVPGHPTRMCVGRISFVGIAPATERQIISLPALLSSLSFT